MPEVDLVFPRAYVEFVDPADEDQVFRCDLTWLTSSYMCIFGQGCQGIYADAPDTGCCTLGAHFADKDDESRVAAYVAAADAGAVAVPPRARREEGRLGREGRRRRAQDADPASTRDSRRASSTIAQTSAPARVARSTASRCEQGRNPLETKPDVCWQLPIRRTFRNVERQDGTTYTEVAIGEYDRRGWGPGGHDLDWYCSGNTEAHVALEPVFVTHEAELTELMGVSGYAELVTPLRGARAVALRAGTCIRADPR